MKTKKKLVLIIAVFVVLIGLDLFFGWQNKALLTTEIAVENENIPSSFSGFRIVQVSDLHNTTFGFKNKKLLEAIEKAKPDIIVITGDLVDMNRTEIDVALSFSEKAVDIAPVYFVTGNHDVKAVGRTDLLEGLKKCGVSVMRNKKTEIEKSGQKITLLGIDDPKFLDDFMAYDDKTNTKIMLDKLNENKNNFTVLLAHRAEMIDVFSEAGIDLVLTGHAHGGQIRLPGYGGVLAPGQGWFPEYDSGLYRKQGTQMIVSRGLGNSAFPFRINNRPEIIVAELISICEVS